MTSVVMIAGDGIGPEVTAAMQRSPAAGADSTWIEAMAGLAAAPNATAIRWPAATLELIRSYRVALKGPCTTPVGKGFRSINVRLREKELDLYASVRPVSTCRASSRALRQRRSGRGPRKHRGAVFAGRSMSSCLASSRALPSVTRTRLERIIRYAFELARTRPPQRHVLHKADVMPLSDGLFLTTARAVADDYPFLEYEEMHIDQLCSASGAIDPRDFDVLVMENLFGDVVDDLCAGLVGGLGLVPGANIGQRYAVFEAVHGSAPDIAGKGLANPIALVRSAAMMLEHIGQRQPPQRIEASVRRTLSSAASASCAISAATVRRPR